MEGIRWTAGPGFSYRYRREAGQSMACKFYTTKDYHENSVETLGWELTVCNALYPEGSPLRRILKKNATYGRLLSSYLRRFIPTDKVKRVIEIGAGYGFLMKDLLEENRFARVIMLDVSPYLLQKQRELLRHPCVEFRREDFLETDPAVLEGMDLAVLNENLGDFPVLTGVGREFFSTEELLDEPLLEVRELLRRYAIQPPGTFPFNLNIGALKAVEKLCLAKTPYIFLSEHSCEASVPEPLRPFVRVSAPGVPERIRLHGHDEYTVKFSHIESVCRSLGYTSVRGPIADFIPFDFDERMRVILKSPFVYKDEHEIIHHFVEDLYQYEYLLLIRDEKAENEAEVECRRCGKCCLTDFIAYVTAEDLARWRREGREDILGMVEREHAVWAGDRLVSSESGKDILGCPFLAWEGDHSTCTIYETRPGVCRRFKPASSALCGLSMR